MSKKKTLGQFYTTNYNKILQGLTIPKNVSHIIEPFAGKKDLLKKFNKTRRKLKITCYDIDPKEKKIIKRDTLLNPPNYNNKFIITNPPYLARNKSENKTLFDKYGVNDLYKCFIKNLLTNICKGGILIIPLNFWCSIRIMDIDLRKNFLKLYNVISLNIFEETVFDDTSYTVCSFQFEKKNISSVKHYNKHKCLARLKSNICKQCSLNKRPNSHFCGIHLKMSSSIHRIDKNITTSNINNIPIYIFPSKRKIEARLCDENNYLIGGSIYNLLNKNEYKINRITSKNENNIKYHTNILAKCIDDNKNHKIKLMYVKNDEKFIDRTPKLSSRTYATLYISPPLSQKKQQELVKNFNIYLNNHRKKYNSLFLANYRESKDISRKRISFSLIYKIVKYLLN